MFQSKRCLGENLGLSGILFCMTGNNAGKAAKIAFSKITFKHIYNCNTILNSSTAVVLTIVNHRPWFNINLNLI